MQVWTPCRKHLSTVVSFSSNVPPANYCTIALPSRSETGQSSTLLVVVGKDVLFELGHSQLRSLWCAPSRTTVFARWLLQGEGTREVQRESQLRLISQANCWWQTLSWHHVHSGGGPCFENSCWKARHAKTSPSLQNAILVLFWLCKLYQLLIAP